MLSALAEEPLFHVFEHRREDARRRWASLALVALVYGGIAAAILLEPTPPVPTRSQEIPVEIVVEPPQQAPPPPEPEPKKAEKPPDKDERPAYDAPKEGKASEDDPDRKAEAKPPPTKEAPAPKPAEATPEPTQPPAPPLKTAEDGDLPEAAPTSQNAAPAKPLFAAGKGKLFAAMPNVGFGGAPMKAPVAGGEGPAEYLNIVVGLVRAHLHKPRVTQPFEGIGFGLIVFRLDASGTIIESHFVQHSGSSAYDEAEMNALTAAAPFPKPPYLGRAIEYRFVVE